MHQAGKMRTLLQVERRSTAVDGVGQQVTTWTNVGAVYAWVQSLSGRELLAAQAVQAEATHSISCRYFAGLSAKDRFVYTDPARGTIYYDISFVADDDLRHRYTTCTAIEGLAVG